MDLFVLSASLGLNITGFENGINKAKNLLKQFGAAVVDFGKDVVETGMNFDKQMSAVQAVMGLTEDTEENLKTMNGLREFALEQARDSIFTSEETAKAYYYMGMAGWKAEQMTAGLPGVMALAAASGEDLKLTSDMVTDSLTAFGLGAGQASHFADVLAVAATNSNTDVARMQQTFKNLAPIAGALGYSIEDVALTVGLLANAGVKGSQAGTSLRNIFTRIATNAGATKNTLGALQIITDELGVSFYTAEGRARPWGEVLMDMRKAWRQLNPNEVDAVTAAFGEFSAESQSADEIMEEFSNNLDTWVDEWNGLATNVERNNFVAELEPMFNALGISMRDSNGNLREFSAVAKDARVKLGGFTDEEQIYYGKQIGSLRGITGWLALMNASEEDVNSLVIAIENADGAAQAMADTRLDNLWGDVIKFNSALDVMKIALYDDVKGPLRDIMQSGTESIHRITDAIEKDGLIGGIEQLGVEIESMSKTVSPILESIGKMIAPIISTVITEIIPAVLPAAVEVGKSLGKGLIDGLKDEPAVAALFTILGGTKIGSLFGLTPSAVGKGAATAATAAAPKIAGAAAGAAPYVAPIAVGGVAAYVIDKNYVGRMFGDANETASEWDELREAASDTAQDLVALGDTLYGLYDYNGSRYVDEYGDHDMYAQSQDNVQYILDNWDMLANMFGDLGEKYGLTKEIIDNYNSTPSNDMGLFYSAYGDLFQSAIGQMLTDLANEMTSASGDIGTDLETAVTEGGDAGAANMQASLEGSGDAAATYIYGAIQGELNELQLPEFSVSISTDGVEGIGHATAVSSGEILHGMTPFGIDSRGNLHYGGETQDEVVVGVNSLNHMIQKSVNAAMAKTQPPQKPIVVQLVLDSGVLLGEVDIGLNEIANWRGGGRA